MKTKDYFGSNWKEMTFKVGKTEDNKNYIEFEVVYKNNVERDESAKAIHESLCGNKSYINSDIVLNIDEPNTMKLFVTEDANDLPDELMEEIKNKAALLAQPET